MTISGRPWHRHLAVLIIAAAPIPTPVCAGEPAAVHREDAGLQEKWAVSEEEYEALIRIIDEGRDRNQTMVHLTYLCEEIGPRLTGSSRLERANRWAAEQFESFGLSNVHLHEWGTIPVRFDRGPSSGRMVKPVEREFEFTARAWSAGTDGLKQGRVFREPSTDEEFEAIESELEGAWILRPHTTGHRRGVVPGVDESRQFLPQLREAGIAGLIIASRDDLVRTGSARGWRELSFDDLPTDVTVIIRRSDYDAINSRIFDGEEVVVEFDLEHTFVEGPISC
jgi:carboxypeptidase Q